MFSCLLHWFSKSLCLLFKAVEQAKRYEGLSSQCKNVSGQQDLSNFARILPFTPNLLRVPKKIFAPPQPPAPVDGEESQEYTVNIWLIFSTD